MLQFLVMALLGKAHFWLIVLAWVYCSIVIRRDKKDRKAYKRIVRQEARKQHTRYIAADMSNVVYLSKYRNKRNRQNPA